jgi:hypothetical protein
LWVERREQPERWAETELTLVELEETEQSGDNWNSEQECCEAAEPIGLVGASGHVGVSELAQVSGVAGYSVGGRSYGADGES